MGKAVILILVTTACLAGLFVLGAFLSDAGPFEPTVVECRSRYAGCPENGVRTNPFGGGDNSANPYGGG